jgi:hypothetical protein
MIFQRLKNNNVNFRVICPLILMAQEHPKVELPFLYTPCMWDKLKSSHRGQASFQLSRCGHTRR